jgi:inosine-uridine nucleoside N-ribohydrolase
VVTAGWSTATLVGLDVTYRATFTPELFAAVDALHNNAGRFLSEPLQFYRRFGGTFCEVAGEYACHDLLAAMVAVLPGMVASGRSCRCRYKPHRVRPGVHDRRPASTIL